MKRMHFKKVISLILCLGMVLSLFGSMFAKAEEETKVNNTSPIKVSVEYGKGEADFKYISNGKYTYMVKPDKGYKIWRIVSESKYMDRLETGSILPLSCDNQMSYTEKDEAYEFSFNTKDVYALKVYFVTDSEYEQMKGSTSDDYGTIWDNPKWFFKDFGDTFDEDEFNEVYGDYIKAQKEKDPEYNTFSTSLTSEELAQMVDETDNSSSGIMSVQADYNGTLTVGQTFSGTFAKNTGNQGKLSGYTIIFSTGILAGKTLAATCTERKEWYPVSAGSYTATVTSVNTDKAIATLRVITTPSDSREQNTECTATLSYNKPEGYLTLTKESSDTTKTNGSSCYSLSGAVYKVYSKKDASTTALATLTTDENGKSNTVTLNAGTYYVLEATAPKGYAKDTTWHEVKIESSKTSTLSVKDKPLDDPVNIVKNDAESGKNHAKGKASIGGAEFTYTYYKSDDCTGTPERTWVYKADENGLITFANYKKYKISGDESYLRADGNATCPLGSVTIKETKAPEGYSIDPTTYKYQITTNEKGEAVRLSLNPDDYGKVVTQLEIKNKDQVLRSSMKFTKVAVNDDGKVTRKVANCVFKVTSNKTGEVHFIVTDKNGEFDSSKLTATKNTNKNDDAVSYKSGKAAYVDGKFIERENDKLVIDESKISSDYGVWFSMDSASEMTAAKDDLGAFCYDDYTFEEVRTSVNKGLQLITFNATSDEFKENEADIKNVIDLGTHNDKEIYIKTNAYDKKDNDQTLGVGKDNTVVDKVTYANLNTDTDYTLKAYLVDNEDSKECTYNLGESHIYYSEKDFTPKKENGSELMEFDIDTTKLVGKTFTVYEYLYQDDTLIATHTIFECEDQTIKVSTPEVITKAKDSKTLTNTNKPNSKTTLIDSVDYSGLNEGETYFLKATLMDKETEKPYEDSEGNTYSLVKEFTAGENGKGSEEMEINVSTKNLDGKNLVFFEEISVKEDGEETIVGFHEDIEDEGQTVIVTPVEVDTKAYCKKHKTNEIYAQKKVRVIDEVTYANLDEGEKYTIVGKIVDKDTGKVIDSIKSPYKEFICEKSEDTIDMEFTFNATALAKKNLVVFEEIYEGWVKTEAEEEKVSDEDKETENLDSDVEDKNTSEGDEEALKETSENKVLPIAGHCDINDKDQSIYVKPISEPKTGDFVFIILAILFIASISFIVVYSKKDEIFGRK